MWSWSDGVEKYCQRLGFEMLKEFITNFNWGYLNRDKNPFSVGTFRGLQS